jgi:hypothetical protein
VTDNHADPDLIEPTDEWMKEHGFVPVNFVEGFKPDDGAEYYQMEDRWGRRKTWPSYRVGGSRMEKDTAHFLLHVEQVAAVWTENNRWPQVVWMLTVETRPYGQRANREEPSIPPPMFWLPGEEGISAGRWMTLDIWERSKWYGPYGSVTYFLPMLKSFLRERGWM